MKKFIKNNIKIFMTILITTIVVGSASVYAASQYFAKDITFTPANEKFKKENGEPIENVEDALNELYNLKNCKKGEITVNESAMTTSGQIVDSINNLNFFSIYNNSLYQVSYNKIFYSDKVVQVSNDYKSILTMNLGQYYDVVNNQFVIKNFSSNRIGTTYNYIICS